MHKGYCWQVRFSQTGQKTETSNTNNWLFFIFLFFSLSPCCRFISAEDREWFEEATNAVVHEHVEAELAAQLHPEPYFVDFLRDAPEPTGEEEDDACLDAPKIYELVRSWSWISCAFKITYLTLIFLFSIWDSSGTDSQAYKRPENHMHISAPSPHRFFLLKLLICSSLMFGSGPKQGSLGYCQRAEQTPGRGFCHWSRREFQFLEQCILARTLLWSKQGTWRRALTCRRVNWHARDTYCC